MVLRVCTTMYMEPHPRISKMYCKVLFGSQENSCMCIGTFTTKCDGTNYTHFLHMVQFH